MRIYMNKKEAAKVKSALLLYVPYGDPESKELINRLLDRIELCQSLQENERKSKEKA